MSDTTTEFQCIGRTTSYHAQFSPIREVVLVGGKEQIEYRNVPDVKIRTIPTAVTSEQASELRKRKYFGQMFIEVGNSAATQKAAEKVLEGDKKPAKKKGASEPTVLEGVSTNQEAREALSGAGVDLKELSSKATTADIVAFASENGYTFDGWGE